VSYRLTDDAVEDIEELLAYIAQDSRPAAERVHGHLLAAFRRIGEQPELGHYREDLAAKPLRFWRVHSYLIVYRPEQRPVQIIRVLSGFRDIPNLLPE
jgi:plasmid stabilization system protein ParE